MQNENYHRDQWFALFPDVAAMENEHRKLALDSVQFPQLDQGEIAYLQGWECQNYLMCLEGQTRVFRTSNSGREVLIYRVTSGSTCVLTTQCLLTGGTFPAESNAESKVRLAALPAATFRHLMSTSPNFRNFVLNDYARLLGDMFALLEDVAFKNLDQRLAGRLLAEADPDGIVKKTHQQLAYDIGSARKVVSPHLATWERNGWVTTARGSIQILDRSARHVLANQPISANVASKIVATDQALVKGVP